MKSNIVYTPVTADHTMCSLFYDTTALIKQINFSHLDDVASVLSIVKNNIDIIESSMAKDSELHLQYNSGSGSNQSFIAENHFDLNANSDRLLFSGKY